MSNTDKTQDHWPNSDESVRESKRPSRNGCREVLYLSGDIQPLPLARLPMHMAIFGSSGSGKSAMIADILDQLVELAAYTGRGPTVITISGKQEEYLFNQEREQCEKFGIDFQLINMRDKFATHAYNPLRKIRELSPSEAAESLMEGLGLKASDKNKEDFWSNLDYDRILDDFSSHNSPRSFADWWENLESIDINEKFAPRKLKYKVRKHANVPLQNPRVGVRQIDIEEALQPGKAKHIYVNVPDDSIPDVIHEFCKILTKEVYTTCVTSPIPVSERNMVVLIFDECAPILSPTLLRVLDKARSANLAMIFSTQNIEQLRKVSGDVADLLIAGVGHIIHFSPAKDMSFFLETSPTYWHVTRNQSESNAESHSVTTGENGSQDTVGSQHTESWSESRIERPKFDRNRLLRMSAIPNRFLFQAWTESHGFEDVGKPIICDHEFHVGKETFERRQRSPFPTELILPGMMINSWDDRTAPPMPDFDDSEDIGDVDSPSSIDVGAVDSTIPIALSPLSEALFGSGGRVRAFLENDPYVQRN